MADPIISVVVEKLADFLLKQAKEEIDLLTGGVERETNNLMNTLKMIQAVLADAEQRMIKDNTVKAWLHDLEDLSYEIDDVLDEWNYMILKQQIEGSSNVNHDASPSIGRQLQVCSFIPSSSCFCFKKVFVRRDVAKKIKDLNERLDLIEKRKNQFGFITSIGVASSNSQEWKRVQSTSFLDVSEVRGRISDKDNLVTQLLSGRCQEEANATQILSIVGTGGIGKTTLAQIAYNDDEVKGYFEKKAWVCVSNPFDEIRVAKAIVQSLESSSPNLDELEPLLNRIKDCISGKRILLVFDDVWTEERMKWEPFKNVLMYGAPGSTILLTTRSERVARVVGARIIPLSVLSDLDSWSLFYQIAFSGQTTQSERLEDIGRKITRKCKGLPLAIKTIASLLRFKNNVEEWQRVMNSNTWELDVAEVELFPHLYLSYNDLSPQMRRCFTYCAAFPKDEKLVIGHLISIWMAQGYLKSSGSQDEMMLEGREIFENLALRSFFQDFKFDEFDQRIFSCKMHDIVHDFAQFLSKKECLIIEGARKLTICENARHVTWLGRGITNTHFGGNIGEPRSFFASYLILSHDLLNSLKLVRVLVLDWCDLKELPMGIEYLIHLRYLRMWKCKLRELPRTVYGLYNLQTLLLLSCYDLLELPPGIEKLAKLRYLTFDKIYPVGIEKLTCLRTLEYFSIGRGFNKFESLKNLNQLRSLGIVIKENLEDATECGSADLKSKIHIQTLVLLFEFEEDIRVKEDVMEALEPPPNLENLLFYGYGETRFPTWMTTSLNNLTRLKILICSRLTSLPPLGILPSLEQLHIERLYELEIVDLSFFGIRVVPDLDDVQHATLLSPTIGFPKLIELSFKDCYRFAEWEDIGGPEDEVDAIPILPRLRRLIIVWCPELRVLPHRLLRKASSLEYIELDRKKYDPSTILSTEEGPQD